MNRQRVHRVPTGDDDRAAPRSVPTTAHRAARRARTPSSPVMSTTRTILHLTSSARVHGSASRALSQTLIERLTRHAGGARAVVKTRDVGATQAPSFVNDAWIAASFTPEENRTAAQKEALKESDALIEELKASDVLVIGASMCTSRATAARAARDGVMWMMTWRG